MRNDESGGVVERVFAIFLFKKRRNFAFVRDTPVLSGRLAEPCGVGLLLIESNPIRRIILRSRIDLVALVGLRELRAGHFVATDFEIAALYDFWDQHGSCFYRKCGAILA